MDNPGKLFGQIAAEAGVTDNSAKIAVYMLGLSKDGRSLDYTAKSLRLALATCKRYAREYLIDFADYRPFAKQRDKGAAVEPKYRLDIGNA